MAYKTEELKRLALEKIEKHRLFFIEDVVAYLPCVKDTFYGHKLHEDKEVQEALFENKVKTKNSLRSKWFGSQNATLQISLYKLICSDEERKALSQSHVDMTTQGEKIYNLPPLNFVEEEKKTE